jgi:phosphatidate cytidylyltransferase
MYPRGQSLWNKRWVGFCLGWILFIPTWLSLDWLHADNNFGPIWVVFLCFLVWGADVGAYCTGKLWGKKKLIEQVSAGKTWVGVFGAFFFAFMVVVLFANFWLKEQRFIVLVALSIIVVIASILGDLTESLFKRIRGVKDSGNLLPGHGGVLDRIDGLLAAVPIFIVGINFFQSCKG